MNIPGADLCDWQRPLGFVMRVRKRGAATRALAYSTKPGGVFFQVTPACPIS